MDITIPLSYLIELITHNYPPFLNNIPTQSNSQTQPDFKPYITRYEIGVLLKEKDKEEIQYKVHLFPATPHAEIWNLQEWKESAASQEAFSKASREASQKALKERARWNVIEGHFLSLSFPVTVARQLTQALMSPSITDEVLQQFGVLEKLRKLD